MRWTAQYKDGSQDVQGPNSSYEDINRENLVAFALHDGTKNVLTIDFSNGDGRSLVWRRRVEQTPGEDSIIIHIVGKKGKYICMVFEDGSVVTVDNFVEGSRWLYPPQFRSNEV